MPRVYDYKNSSTELDAKVLDIIRLGYGEISPEQIEKEDKIPGIHHGLAKARHHQFSLQSSCSVWSNQVEIEQVFTWLEENTTGPWHWQESWSNNGHSLGVHIHLERQNDQQAFQATWAHLFNYREDRESDLDRLAIIKGVLPPHEAFFDWVSNSRGFRFPEHPSDPSLVRIQFDIQTAEDLFCEQWVDTGFFKPVADTSYCYEGPSFHDDFEMMVGFRSWLDAHRAFDTNVNYTPPGSDTKACLTVVRYPEAEGVFRAKWGDKFDEIINPQDHPSREVIARDAEKGPFYKLFIGPWLTIKPRSVPSDFLEYLRGVCDFTGVRAPYDNFGVIVENPFIQSVDVTGQTDALDHHRE